MTIKIILIDDHTLFRSGIKALLSRQHGFEVIGEAADGLSGIKMISRLQPDVVLLDLDMPGMNGRERLVPNHQHQSAAGSHYADRFRRQRRPYRMYAHRRAATC